VCAHCGAERRKSAERPPGDADPAHPGLLVVTADTFDELVLRSEKHVLLAVTADWCGPCKQLKPHLYRLARLFADAGELAIAVMDADTNDKDARFLSEKYVPNVKLFVKGKKTKPIAYRGARVTDAILAFIGSNTAIDVEKLARQSYVEFRSAKGLVGVQRRMLGALLATRPPETGICAFLTSWLADTSVFNVHELDSRASMMLERLTSTYPLTPDILRAC
jgi:thioredoxin-like negative regulator of GroEL